MRIQVMSDLHFEFHRDCGESFVQSLDPTDVDVLVLAGDVGTAIGESLLYGVARLCDRYPQVVMIAGNHEYYGSSPDQVAKVRERMLRALPNFNWLDNSTVELGGQRFIGSTLWYPKPANPAYTRAMSDFTTIRGFVPWVYTQHRASVAFLTENVREDDVVLTHMLPTPHAISPRWRHSPLNCFFAVDTLPQPVLDRPRVWIFGHTHDSRQYRQGNCQYVCNPFGYVGNALNAQFDDQLCVRLP